MYRDLPVDDGRGWRGCRGSQVGGVIGGVDFGEVSEVGGGVRL